MKLIDSHCHLNFSSFKDDYKQIIADCLNKDIGIINIGANLNTSVCAVEIANNYNNIYATIGLHPTESEKFDENKYQELIDNNKSKIIAIGEIGLDYFHNFDQQQKETFIQQLKFAQKNNLPVVLHARGSKENPQDAYLDMIEILKNQDFPICHSGESRNPEDNKNSLNSLDPDLRRDDKHQDDKKKGVIHCFGSSLEIAKKFLDLGFYIGFTGIITFKNKSVNELREVVKAVPLDKILIETDAPYLSPEPYRGQKNKPQNVEFVARKIAEIKNISFSEVCQQTSESVNKVFKI